MKRPGYLWGLSPLADRNLFARIKAAFQSLRECLKRDPFFGDSYHRNSDDLAACLREVREVLECAEAFGSVYLFADSASSDRTAAQLLGISSEATEEWNEWVRIRLRTCPHRNGEFHEISRSIDDFSKAIVAVLRPARMRRDEIEFMKSVSKMKLCPSTHVVSTSEGAALACINEERAFYLLDRWERKGWWEKKGFFGNAYDGRLTENGIAKAKELA